MIPLYVVRDCYLTRIRELESLLNDYLGLLEDPICSTEMGSLLAQERHLIEQAIDAMHEEVAP